MLWFWRTLVADAYPLICPVASSACSDQNQPLEPGCWFSKTIGLSAASCELAGATPANRLSRVVTTIRLSLIDAAPSPLGPSAPYLARCGGRGAGHLPLRWRRALVSEARGRRSHRGDQVVAVEQEVAALTCKSLGSQQGAGNRVNP